MDSKPLDFKEWRAKTAQRHSGWDNARVSAAYDQYLRSVSTHKPQPHRQPRSTQRPAKSSKAEIMAAISGRRTAAVQENPYFSQLAAPFAVNPKDAVGFPDGVTGDSVVFMTTFDVAVPADTNGNACFFLRPAGPENCIMTSGATSDASIVWSDTAGGTPFDAISDYPNLMYNLTFATGAFSALTAGPPSDKINFDALSGSYAGWSAQSVPQLSALKSAYSQLRCVGAACEFINTQSDNTRQGEIAISRWDGAMDAPTIYNRNLALGVAYSGEIDPSALGAGVNFTNISTLPNAQVYSLPKNPEITARWCPTTYEGAVDFRPTSYRPTWVSEYTTGLLTADPTPDAGGHPQTNSVVAVAPAVGASSAELRSFYNTFFGTNAAVTCNTSDATLANYSGRGLYDAQEGGIGLALFGLNTSYREEAFALTSMGQGDAGIVAVASQMQPSTYTISGGVAAIEVAQQAFTVRVRMIYEGIPVTSLFQPSTNQSETKHHSHLENALHAAALLEPAHPGKANTNTVAASVKQVVTTAAQKAPAVVESVAKIADAASSGNWVDVALEVASIIGEVFL